MMNATTAQHTQRRTAPGGRTTAAAGGAQQHHRRAVWGAMHPPAALVGLEARAASRCARQHSMAQRDAGQGPRGAPPQRSAGTRRFVLGRPAPRLRPGRTRPRPGRTLIGRTLVAVRMRLRAAAVCPAAGHPQHSRRRTPAPRGGCVSCAGMHAACMERERPLFTRGILCPGGRHIMPAGREGVGDRCNDVSRKWAWRDAFGTG